VVVVVVVVMVVYSSGLLPASSSEAAHGRLLCLSVICQLHSRRPGKTNLQQSQGLAAHPAAYAAKPGGGQTCTM
jgi:hypothetical protein